MKKILFGLLVIGLTNLTYAQHSSKELELSKFNAIDATLSKASNEAYLEGVTSNGLSLKVKKLEDIVANYDITKAAVYEAEIPSTYGVTFKESGNLIIATYNKEGEIISSFEKFRNVKLPLHLSQIIIKKYPGWAFSGNSYTVHYTQNKAAKKVYTVQIKKGNQRIPLKFNASDIIGATYLVGL